MCFREQPNEVLYFTNRLEIGKDSVYEELEEAQHLLHETVNPNEFARKEDSGI